MNRSLRPEDQLILSVQMGQPPLRHMLAHRTEIGEYTIKERAICRNLFPRRIYLPIPGRPHSSATHHTVSILRSPYSSSTESVHVKREQPRPNRGSHRKPPSVFQPAAIYPRHAHRRRGRHTLGVRLRRMETQLPKESDSLREHDKEER